MHVADGGCPHDQLEAVHEPEDFILLRVFQLETDNRAIKALRQKAADRSGIRMRRISRKIDALDSRVSCQPGGDAASVGALALHAQRKGFDAAHRQIALERTQYRSD